MKDITLKPINSKGVRISIRVIARQAKIRNSIQILDRLLEHGGIAKENYIKELQNLYTM